VFRVCNNHPRCPSFFSPLSAIFRLLSGAASGGTSFQSPFCFPELFFGVRDVSFLTKDRIPVLRQFLSRQIGLPPTIIPLKVVPGLFESFAPVSQPFLEVWRLRLRFHLLPSPPPPERFFAPFFPWKTVPPFCSTVPPRLRFAGHFLCDRPYYVKAISPSPLYFDFPPFPFFQASAV